MATLNERLHEAEDAHHKLSIGKAVAEFRDSNGELVRYTKADLPTLASYIEDLKRQTGAGCPNRPMNVFI